jgi:hypothetical protein
MKTKLLIISMGLVAASAYAQPSIPAGVSPPVNRPEVNRQVVPSMPQPVMQRPAPQPAVGASQSQARAEARAGAGAEAGDKLLLDAKTSATLISGPQPAVGASQSEAQAFSEAREEIYYEVSDKKASANPDGAVLERVASNPSEAQAKVEEIQSNLEARSAAIANAQAKAQAKTPGQGQASRAEVHEAAMIVVGSEIGKLQAELPEGTVVCSYSCPLTESCPPNNCYTVKY